MGQAFEDGSISLPEPEPLPGCSLPHLPCYLVGDEIFALKPWLQRPYPGKNVKEDESIFNYRLSRARRVIKNCFGILVARWRIFRRAIQTKVETTVGLHNYLQQTDSATYCPAGFVDSFASSGNILPEGWCSIIPARMRVPVLFATYLLQEAQDIAIMIWKSERPWKPTLIQSKVQFPGSGITYVAEVLSLYPRITLSYCLRRM